MHGFVSRHSHIAHMENLSEESGQAIYQSDMASFFSGQVAKDGDKALRPPGSLSGPTCLHMPILLQL